MEENELRAVLAGNIKKLRTRRGWNQLLLAEKLGISSNFLSEIETCKGWVSPLTLVKLANTLEIDVYELFLPKNNRALKERENKKIKRFAKDVALALDASSVEAIKLIKKTISKVSGEYL